MKLLLQARIRGCDEQSRRSALRHTVGDWPFFWRLSPSEERGQALQQTAEPVPSPPSARLASRLHAFVTNLHE